MFDRRSLRAKSAERDIEGPATGNRNLRAVRLEGIQIGALVEVDRLGRRFHALVTGNTSGGPSIQPAGPAHQLPPVPRA